MLSLRLLKAFRVTAEYGNISNAARRTNKTQSTISKSIQTLEQHVGLRLLDRATSGVKLTPSGQVFIPYVIEVEHQFLLAAEEYRRITKENTNNNPLFNMEISTRRLLIFLALYDTKNIAASAQQLGLSRAAVYTAIKDIECLLNTRLFERNGGHLTSTRFGDILARHCKLALSIIQDGLEALASTNDHITGKIVLGTLPYSRTLLTPRAISKVLSAHPKVNISTREGPYKTLLPLLYSGEIDAIIGATRPSADEHLLKIEHLLDDELSVIVGINHPLLEQQSISLNMLMDYVWILPLTDTPSRSLFDNLLKRHKLPHPKQVVETSSLSLVRGMLLENNYVALLSKHQISLDQKANILAPLPINLEGTIRPIGITYRKATTPSPALTLFINALKQLAS